MTRIDQITARIDREFREQRRLLDASRAEFERAVCAVECRLPKTENKVKTLVELARVADQVEPLESTLGPLRATSGRVIVRDSEGRELARLVWHENRLRSSGGVEDFAGNLSTKARRAEVSIAGAGGLAPTLHNACKAPNKARFRCIPHTPAFARHLSTF